MEILNFFDLIKLIWQNKILLLKIMGYTAVISAGLSFLLPVYYKSTTTMFPARSTQVPVTETATRKGSYSDFGETSESEQSLEIINSTRLLDKVIKKFNLFNHYEIDSSKQFAYTDVINNLKDNLISKRNKYNSIEISIIDKDPKVAADIANSFPLFYDTVKFELIQARSNELINNLQKSYAEQSKVIDSLKTVMDTLTGKGIMSQFQRGYLIDAYGKSGPNQSSGLKKLVDDNIQSGEVFDILERTYEREVDNLMFIRRFLVQAKADANIEFTQKFVVDKAIPAERKHSPVRWLFVLVSVCSSLFFATSALLLKRKWPAIKNMLQD
ncbi:MAG: Wzz/FepE/Etk N-terminal domain-containing protein [Saprospiraceae bacterium]